MIFRSGCAAQMSSSMLKLLAGLTNEAMSQSETGSLVFAQQI